MNVQKLEMEISKRLHAGGVEEPRLEASWIIEHFCEHPELEIENLVQRRLAGEPLAYVLGIKGFYKYEFLVRSGVLIPRPETEFVVEGAISLFRKNPKATVLYDWGFGSGCIGLTLLKEIPNLELWGWDQSDICFSTAQKNAERLSVEMRATFFKESVSSFQFSKVPKADLIVSNPPYIALGDKRVESHVLKYEPQEALFSGDTGLELIFSWSKIAWKQLAPNGGLVMEVGIDQRKVIDEYLMKIGFKNISWIKDLAGIDRVFVAIKGE